MLTYILINYYYTTVKMLTKNDLTDNQFDTIRTALKKKRLGVMDDCGAGKTVMGLSIAGALVKHGLKVLVVTKPGILKESVWYQETQKWEHLSELNIVEVKGAKRIRHKQLNHSHADIIVTSYNTLKSDYKLLKRKFKFQGVILDEFSIIKSTKSVYRSILLKLAPKATYRIGLSATPKSASEIDLWGICRWLDGGEALGKYVTPFRAKYLIGHEIQGRMVYKIRNEAARVEIQEAVKHLFISHELPKRANIPIQVRFVNAALTKKAQAIYNELEDSGYITSIDDPSFTPPVSDMQRVNQLSILTSGFVYRESLEQLSIDELRASPNIRALLNNRSRKAIPLFDDRILLFKRLINRVRATHGKSVNIAIPYTYKQELVQLKEMFPSGLSDKDHKGSLSKKWNTGDYSEMFLQYQRSSMGLNLQGGGFILCPYSQTYTFENMYQMIRRLARQGQKAPLVYVYILNLLKTRDVIKKARYEERSASHEAFNRMVQR